MPIEIERKFLLAEAPDWGHPLLRSAAITHFEQIYLTADRTEQKRIRRSRIHDVDRYHYAHLVPIRWATRQVIEREIDRKEYERLRRQRDPARHIVRKARRCFTWEHQLFELEDIREPSTRACHLLELQVEQSNQKIDLPDFLKIDREVTGEAAYSNATIALG